MSYKGKKKSTYGQVRRNSAKMPFSLKEASKKKRLGLTISEDTRVIKCSQPLSEINEEQKTSVGGCVGNQAGSIGGSLAKEDKKQIKIPKNAKYV